MTRSLIGAAALLCAASASAVDLECYEHPRTNAMQCIDAAGVKMTKDGIRYSKLYAGGPAEVRDTRFTIHANCATGVVHLKDRQGVSFAGGYGVETKAVASLQKWICEAKVRK